MIALVDCNNFYASCERVFRPDLQGKPVVVLSNNDGCVIARSEEVKRLGIEMGTPYYQIEKLVGTYGIAVFSSNYTLYGDMSARVMAVLRDFVEEMEVYSIDEAFLNLSGYERLNLKSYAKTIVDTVRQNTGIPVSMGIAGTKTLAKIASKFAKKYKRYQGVCIIATEEQRVKALKLVDVGEVWGIGHRYKRKLNQQQVMTAYDFTCLPESWVRRQMTVEGVRTWRELQGMPCLGMELAVAKKSICTSRAFGTLITEYAVLSEAVAEFTANCARKLREQHTVAGAITVFIHTNPFRENSVQYSSSRTARLEVPANNSGELIRTALNVLKEIFAPGYELKKAGVIVSQIYPANEVQGNLFYSRDFNRLRMADTVMDRINHAFGKNTLKLAAQGFNTKWRLNNRYLSRRFTTDWNELLEIH